MKRLAALILSIAAIAALGLVAAAPAGASTQAACNALYNAANNHGAPIPDQAFGNTGCAG